MSSGSAFSDAGGNFIAERGAYTIASSAGRPSSLEAGGRNKYWA